MGTDPGLLIAGTDPGRLLSDESAKMNLPFPSPKICSYKFLSSLLVFGIKNFNLYVQVTFLSELKKYFGPSEVFTKFMSTSTISIL